MRKLLLLLLLLSPLIGMAQTQDIFVHFDKDFYVTGEDAWYKIYLLNDSDSSRVMHVEWLTPEGQLIEKQLLKIEDGIAYGDLRISENQESGVYTFRAYTKWMLNYGETNLFRQPVSIFVAIDSKNANHQYIAPRVQNAPAHDNLNIQIETDKARYNKREAVKLSVKVTDQNGNPVEAHLSVSVRDQELIPSINTNHLADLRFSTRPSPTTIKYPAEQKIKLSGTLTDLKSQEALLKSGLISVYLVEDQKSILCGLKEGKFSADLPDFFGKRQVQIIDIQPKFPHFLRGAKLDEFKLPFAQNTNTKSIPESIKNYLSWNEERKFFKNTFALENQAPVIDTSNYLNSFEPQNTYLIKDYIAFPKFTDFINEVILPVKIKKKKNSRIVRMVSERDKKFYTEPSMIMIDNKITYDSEKLLTLELTAIKQVDLLRQEGKLKAAFGILGRYGVISVRTQKPDQSGTGISCEGFYKPRDFQPVISDNNNLPDFRPVLYWNPQIKTDANGTATISFPASDDISNYEIIIEGVGRRLTGSSQKRFEVVSQN